MPKKFAWSYSALTGYETCPKQHYHLKVAKDVREAPSKAMLEGQKVHAAFEQRVRDKKPLPGNLSQHEPLCKRFDKTSGSVSVELKLALNQSLEPTEFFARDAWLRGVLDVMVTKGKVAKVFDYKTGKRKPDSEQLKLFAAIVFAAYDHIEIVDTSFLWLNTREVDSARFQRDPDENIIWREFEPRVQSMSDAYDSGHFPARPSGLCRGWCPVKTCDHWEPKE
jgi:hypothetical protein